MMKKILQLGLLYLLFTVNSLHAQNTQSVIAFQYYFDTDPGAGVPGNGAIIPVPASGNSNQTLAIVIPGSLTAGIHNLYIRTKDESGKWGIAERRTFNVQQASQQVTTIQYFFDTDPGPGLAGNGAIVPVTPALNINQTLAISIPGSLTAGIHNLYIRTKDESGKWGIAERRTFYANQATQQVTAYQYFFNNDPGVNVSGNGAIVNITPVSLFDESVNVTQAPGLSNDFHNLYIRTKDAYGRWSLAERAFFPAGNCIANAANGIVAWWSFDDAGPLTEDQTGNYDGLLVNGATTNGYATFDGSNDYMETTDIDELAFGAEDFSIEFLANFSSPGGTLANPADKFIGQSLGAGVERKWTFALGGGQLFFRVSNGTSSQNLVPTPFTPTITQWYHLALTRKGDTLKTFIDGQPSGQQVVSGLLIPDIQTQTTIGWVNWFEGGDQGYMQGKLDEMSVYNRALNEEEIAAIADAGVAGKCRSIVITTASLADALYGEPVSQTFAATLGTPPFTWSVASGTLPAGLTLSTGGILSGTPTEAGEFSFTVQVTDTNNSTGQKVFTQKVLITLPSSQFTIFKSGTTAVPGREM